MSHIEQLVSRQIELCEIRKRLDAEHRASAPGPESPPPHGPCILISREHGSRGSRLAELLGERLGWKVFNREIVDAIAERAHVRQHLIESVDATIRSGWRPMSGHRHAEPAFGPAEYLYHLQQVLRALGHHGFAVIVGRGAQFILPPEHSLRVRVVAPLADRIRRVAEAEHVSPADARRSIETIEAGRAAFLELAFGTEPREGPDFDLVLNTGSMSLDLAARLVLLLAHEKLDLDLPSGPCAK